ncbi:MAG TPA: neutral/alkaline non-lysosomal ceramidase N-terminal domain-containing protein [Chryseolinea sp.]|nr:neutral/alkaline non-lysosomal ceramidase N-terminal domain-containing protein [Chryseolinea sp.]
MSFKKILRFIAIFFIVVIGLIGLFFVVAVVPIDRSIDRTELLTAMTNEMDTLPEVPTAGGSFMVGHAKENLTPPHPTATAGYGKRIGKLYESVHDSIYVRTLIFDNGINRVAIVSADLLIIPPTVTALLEKELPEIGFTLDNTYLGAIHTHNSIGNWGKGATTFLYGPYNDSIVHFIADKIKSSILRASQNLKPATLKGGTIPLDEIVQNRMIDNGPVDSLLRVIEIHHSDSSKLLLMSFTAHATCLFARDLVLSRDYPGKLVDTIEKQGYDFVMFMAGAVGSHAGKVPEQGWSCVDVMSEEVAKGFLSNRDRLFCVNDSTLVMHRVPLLLGETQVKVLKNWRLRPWTFDLAFGDYPEFLTVLRVGNIVMLGAPCDFSGEFNRSIDSLALRHGLHAMVTSFNGGYIGYVTPGKYYDVDHHETQLMNWYGPGNGEYIEECMERLMLTVVR